MSDLYSVSERDFHRLIKLAELAAASGSQNESASARTRMRELVARLKTSRREEETAASESDDAPADDEQPLATCRPRLVKFCLANGVAERMFEPAEHPRGAQCLHCGGVARRGARVIVPPREGFSRASFYSSRGVTGWTHLNCAEDYWPQWAYEDPDDDIPF